MRKVIVFIIFLIILFIVNIWFYFLSEDYRVFLKGLKDNGNTVDLQEKSFSDSLDKEKIFDKKVVGVSNKDDTKIVKKEASWAVEPKNEIALWKNYLDIIALFSSYWISQLHVNSNLFDITDEYPDNYLEYYSENLTLYLFPTKKYTDVYDIFKVLSSELPFTMKEVNNYWEKSLYLNLNNDIEDRFIRMIISYKWIVFWLKIKKTEYDLVKQKLNSLKSE